MKKYLLLCAILAVVNISMAQLEDLPRYLTQEEVEYARAIDYQPPTDRGIANPPPFADVRTMAEWEEVQAVTVSWTSYPVILKQIVAAAKLEVEVIIFSENVTSTENYLLADNAGGPPMTLDNVTILNEQINSVWIRDYGANTCYGSEVGDLFLVDWIYNRPRPDDDVIPDALATHMGLDLYCTTTPPNDLMNTGGNFMSDGFGTGFASELVLDENMGGSAGWTNYPNHNLSEIDGIMDSFMGIDPYIKMPTLPYDGIHHIDMHMKLLDEETLLVSEYPDGVADGPQIEANINYVLNNFTTKWGTPFNVINIPAPPQQSNGNYPDDNGWYLTYANAIFINNTILLPTYYEPWDADAIQIWEDALPGYNIVGIDCDNTGSAIIAAGGAIHCITHTVGVADPLLISYKCIDDTNDDQNPYSLTAYINHQSGIASASLFYKTNLADPYTEIAMTNIGGNDWQASIPTQSYGTTVYYYVEGTANSGKVQTKPMPAPEGYKSFQVINVVFGCTDSSACNYDPAATADDGTCLLPDGCTDPAACNYNAGAQCDDGSCIIGAVQVLSIDTDCWGNETTWNVVDGGGNIVASGGSYADESSFIENVCLADGCYDFNIFDSFGDGLNGSASNGCSVDGDYQMVDQDGNLLFEMAAPDFGSQETHAFCVSSQVSGCTDPAACNYNPLATLDDGSCDLPDGCTDPGACNFDGSASCDNGTCEYITCLGCTDLGACNYDPSASLDDGSCEYLTCAGCTNPLACNYDATATIDDGTCINPDGCTDPGACNYVPAAQCDAGTCEYVTCLGCTDANACNYDSGATIEDGTCTYSLTYYVDADNDGYGNAAVPQDLCNPQAGFVLDNTDCDDSNDQVHPGAAGTGEGIDTNCNLVIDPDEELTTCPGDYNLDGVVNAADLLILLSQFGCASGCSADLTGDDLVNASDLLVFLGAFGEFCP